MNAKIINKQTLREAINISFDSDKEILSLYDSSVPVKSVFDVCENVYFKVMNFYSESEFYGIYEKESLIGYFVCSFGQLISFSLNYKFRTRSYLRLFFKLIKKRTGSPFVCYLYSKNIRGIKWLMKNKMVIDGENGKVTRLVYV
jgi:hypothetical protein